MKVSITSLLIIFTAISGFCGDYYVDSAGNPGDLSLNGTPDNPWGSITQALSQIVASESDPAVIHLKAGEYIKDSGETLPLMIPSYVTLIGENRETTIVDGSDFKEVSVILCIDVNNISISGLTITGGQGTLASSG